MSDPPSTSPPATGRSLDIGRCFQEALDLYKKNFLVLFIAAAITEAVSGVTLGILAGPLIGGWVVMGLFALAFMVRFLRLVLTGITPDMKRGGEGYL